MCVFLLVSVEFVAQNPAVKFSYDENGNRILREIIYVTLIADSLEISDTTNQDNISAIDASQHQVFLTNEVVIGHCNIMVYPNPFIEGVTVQCSGVEPEDNALLDVYNLQGVKLLTVDPLKSMNKLQLNHLSPSTYLMVIKIGNNSSYWKLVKR